MTPTGIPAATTGPWRGCNGARSRRTGTAGLIMGRPGGSTCHDHGFSRGLRRSGRCGPRHGDTLSAEVNLYRSRDGDGLVGAVHVPPQFESRFNDGDTVILNTGSESGQFTVTGTVLIAGPEVGCFAQVGGDWT